MSDEIRTQINDIIEGEIQNSINEYLESEKPKERIVDWDLPIKVVN